MAELIIFMGPTGAGKTVQAENMVQRLGWVHISSGQLLREDPSEAAVMARGDLVVSADVERLVTAAVAQQATGRSIILDGFPRSLDEAKWLEHQLETWQLKLRVVIVFDVDRTTSDERLRKRQRADDTVAALDRKWSAYELATRPVIDYYQQLGLLKHVDGNLSEDEVYATIGSILA
ncbi:nucleoside monophosphate kinase [Candidatus Saccharibacteria bacterium]|nr:nucleoside monophosphate kinase [Candidatus Saccharibacteria bacterium]